MLLVMLIAWSLVQLSSPLSNECSFNIDPGQDEVLKPVKINCTAFPDGTLNTRWEVMDMRVDTIHMDYNCTLQDEELTGNLYAWVTANSHEKTINLLPSNSNYSTIEPTCYIDGCYAWSTDRGGFPTWIIPTATCTLYTPSSPSYSSSTESNTENSSVATLTLLTSSDVATTTPQVPPSEMNVYFLLLLFVFMLIGVLFMLVTFLFIWKPMKRRKREWWLYGDFNNKDMLLGNEPRIDPINRQKNDYCETVTIVDPLDVQPDLALTNMASGGGPFLHEPNQQASNPDEHLFSGDSDSSENVSMSPGSEGSEHEDNSSTGTQIVENGVRAQQSDSEEERLLASTACNSETVNKGGRQNRAVHVIPKAPGAVMTSSHQNETPKESSPALPQPSKSVVTSGQVMSGEPATSHRDKTHCHSNDDWCKQRKLVCASNDVRSSPEYIPSSVGSAASGNRMSSGVISSDIEDGGINNITGDMMEGTSSARELCSSSSPFASEKPSDLPGGTNLLELNQEKAEHVPFCPNESHNLADKSTSKLPVLTGSGVSSFSHKEQTGCAQTTTRQPHDGQQQYHDNYISSSDYTCSSSEQGTSYRTGYSTGGYLADIEDMAVDSISLQSDLESDQSTNDSDESNQGEEVSRSDCENYDHGEIVGLSIALSNSLPHAQRHRSRGQNHYVLSDDDSDLYYAMNAPISLLDSPSSGYIENCQLNVPSPQNTFDSDDGTYEDMTQTIGHVHSDTSHSGYISMNPPNDSHQQNKIETTV